MRSCLFVATTLLVFFSWACRTSPQSAEITMPTGEKIAILDSAAASVAIVTDSIDHFFDIVTLSEMSIQMKKRIGTDRKTVVPEYVSFMKTDVADFTPSEAAWVRKHIENAYRGIQKIGPRVMPTTLKLIKTKGNHYGDGVYYTRQDCIVIPANVLTERNDEAFGETMLHEIFHIYSRYHPTQREALYGLIGFKKLPDRSLNFPDALGKRVLYNPDGVSMNWAMDIKLPDGDNTKIIPVIYASNVGYIAAKPTFFQYLEFELFEIEEAGKGYNVITKPDGKSTLGQGDWADFHRQIRDNTGYIIHPDEVMADNFVFAVKVAGNPDFIKKFSTEGQKLIQDITAILKKS